MLSRPRPPLRRRGARAVAELLEVVVALRTASTHVTKYERALSLYAGALRDDDAR
ncbi:MAG: hypothetical protein U0235_10185 [Polyangiaceae bacterium]